MKNEVKHTAHSSYRCEYHIVFAPKYRRKIIYRGLRKDIGEIMRKLCNEMKVEIIEAEACPDHIHMLVSIPPYMSVSQFAGTLKSKSALMIFDILILDEVLSVGDGAFKAKSEAKMKEMMGGGTTTILVSHSLSAKSARCAAIFSGWTRANRSPLAMT